MRSIYYTSLLSAVLFFSPLLAFLLAHLFAIARGPLGFQDVFMFAAYWIAAGLVWTRFKFMWLIAIFLLSGVIGCNAFALYSNMGSDNSPVFITQLIFSIASLSGALVVAEFLKTKDFDRRDQFSILGAATRYEISEVANLLDQAGKEILGTVTSLSFSGALFRANELPSPFQVKGWSLVMSKHFHFKLSVEVVEFSGTQLRLHFINTNPIAIWKLNRQLKAQSRL